MDGETHHRYLANKPGLFAGGGNPSTPGMWSVVLV
jgi:hypothetical protein